MFQFRKLSEIKVDFSETEKSIFITIDVDWADDVVIDDTIDLLEELDIAATWFITNETKAISRLRDNPKFELGIHPNFNYLLNGDFRNGRTAAEVIDRVLNIVPEAKSVRSHSMTQSSYILKLFGERGITHECNHFIPEQAEIELKPWSLWNGMIKVPYLWEDDLTYLYDRNNSIEMIAARPGLKVFGFHPIHIFLNSENLDRYERTRTIHYRPEELIKYRFYGHGTRNNLKTLIGLNKCVSP